MIPIRAVMILDGILLLAVLWLDGEEEEFDVRSASLLALPIFGITHFLPMTLEPTLGILAHVLGTLLATVLLGFLLAYLNGGSVWRSIFLASVFLLGHFLIVMGLGFVIGNAAR